MPIIYGALGAGPSNPASMKLASPNTVLGLGCWNTEFQPRQTLVSVNTLDFDVTTEEILFNAQHLLAENKMDAIRSVYIDNADGQYPIEIEIATTLQRVTCPEYTQGYFPVMAMNPPEFIFRSLNHIPLRVHFLNVLFPPSLVYIGSP